MIVGNRLEFETVIFNGERYDRVRVAGLAVHDVAGSCPVNGIDQNFLNDGHVVNREGFMTGTEVENLALVTAIRYAAAEHFAALEPADEDQLVGSGNVEAFAVHFFVGDDDFFIRQAVHNGMGGIDDPQDFFCVLNSTGCTLLFGGGIGNHL